MVFHFAMVNSYVSPRSAGQRWLFLITAFLSGNNTLSTAVIRWDENAGLRRDAIRSQVIDALEAQEIKETGNEED
jgi:hypothetical protein